MAQQSSHGKIRHLEHLLVKAVADHGYVAIFLLMVLESACIPIPSEVVMLFGGALAGGLIFAGVHLGLNVVAVALAGTAGNLVGAWLSYAVGRAGGRPLVDRWGRYILLRKHEVDKAERFFDRRGDIAVLIGRVLPVVRTFISLPAGIAEMPLGRFSVFTFVGSLPWTFGLTLAGYSLASNWKAVSQDFTPISVVIGVLILAAIAWWVLRRLREPATEQAELPRHRIRR